MSQSYLCQMWSNRISAESLNALWYAALKKERSAATAFWSGLRKRQSGDCLTVENGTYRPRHVDLSTKSTQDICGAVGTDEKWATCTDFQEGAADSDFVRQLSCSLQFGLQQQQMTTQRTIRRARVEMWRKA